MLFGNGPTGDGFLRRRDGGESQGVWSSSSAIGKSHAHNSSLGLGFADDCLHGAAFNPLDRREKRPLVWIGLPSAILLEDKDAVAEFSRLLLQRQCNQIAETTLWQGVLVGKQPIVRIQADIRPLVHRFGQNMGTELTSQYGGNRLGKETAKRVPRCPNENVQCQPAGSTSDKSFQQTQHLPPKLLCRNRSPRRSTSHLGASDRRR